MKKSRDCFTTLAMTLFFVATASASSLPSQSLTRGESTTLVVDYEIGDVAVTDPKVADFLVQEDRKSVYINAKGEGFATVTLWDTKGEARDAIPLTVYTTNLKGILSEAKQAFASIKTIQFLTQDNTLRMIGEAPSPSDYKRIQAFAARYPQIINEVTMAKPVLDTITDKIEKAIAMPGIKVKSVRDRIVLEGIAYSQSASTRAYEIAKLYDPACLNLIDVRPSDRNPGKEQMVEVELYFMEIQKSALNTFGIQWAPGSFPSSGGGANGSVGGGGGVSSGIGGLGSSLIGFVLNLAPKIRFVREKGLGRVLENPTLFVKSGDLASFFSGVEIPYYSQQNIQFKQAGVKLEAQPIISGTDIDLKISASISSPSPHINGGINNHSISTTAYVPSGQAMVLGGIFSNRDVKTFNRVPTDIATSSALFTLFLSKDFQSSKSELVVFVLPKIAGLSDPKAEQDEWKKMEEEMMKEKSMREYLDYMKGKKKKK
ncbi:MAG: pilus assembly protein N-terminal domain-containing protein [Deltaproteobacteria bacterium]|nr:pilus assembly protein N-terminal domain-containing protein [Deltaproteobacteria bacterium]